MSPSTLVFFVGVAGACVGVVAGATEVISEGLAIGVIAVSFFLIPTLTSLLRARMFMDVPQRLLESAPGAVLVRDAPSKFVDERFRVERSLHGRPATIVGRAGRNSRVLEEELRLTIHCSSRLGEALEALVAPGLDSGAVTRLFDLWRRDRNGFLFFPIHRFPYGNVRREEPTLDSLEQLRALSGVARAELKAEPESGRAGA